MTSVASQPTIERFNPVNPKLLRNPYPTFAEYREVDPVHWGIATLDGLPGSWYLFRHDHNSAVLGEGALFANDPATVGMAESIPPAFRPVAHIFQHWLGGMDPPNHRVLRAVLAKAFTPKRIAALEPEVRRIAGTFLQDAQSRGDGTIDVRADLAFPLPMAVVGAALGVHQEDWKRFEQWSVDVANAIDRAGHEEAGAKGAAAIQAMVDYFARLVAERRKHAEDDLLTAMLAAAADEGTSIQEFDILAIATELGFAGHETTANSVSKAMVAMLDIEGKWQEFGGLGESEVDLAIDELLRITTPVQRQRWRWATADTTVGGKQVTRGQAVVAILAAANRDPEVFPDPDDINFRRANARHLTFGLGSHYCIGSHLARLELRTALRLLADRLPATRLVERPEDMPWRPNFLMPGPERVLVTVGS